MRKITRQQCLELIENLNQAHQAIFSCMKTGDTALMGQLLEACQQTAMALGGVIETSEGEGTEAVAELERYCELAYRLHEKSSEDVDALSASVVRVQNELDEFPETREVVFLPYKVSMWDSLEQMWRKESEKSNTHAVVIPIPYFNRNPDGSAKELVYEGNLYPDDVPVVRYDRYDIKAMHPDAIYIHNPYDDMNLVTSVHPDYYSDKLREYTDDLIYIPYYILEDPNLDSEKSMEYFSHFQLVPGVYNAHHILVQSETMRQAYISNLVKRFGEQIRGHYEEAIRVMESPKVYRVKHPKPEDLEVPLEWKKLIERPDGTRRKVIFYNTAVGTMTNFEGAYIEKIRRVLGIFYENREDVVLLWRPHPLTKATIEAMEPELQADYEQVVEEYCSGGWGIYDESPEMYRAIQLSDAYYGDPSSVLELYKLTNKPIMIENVNL